MSEKNKFKGIVTPQRPTDGNKTSTNERPVGKVIRNDSGNSGSKKENIRGGILEGKDGGGGHKKK